MSVVAINVLTRTHRVCYNYYGRWTVRTPLLDSFNAAPPAIQAMSPFFCSHITLCCLPGTVPGIFWGIVKWLRLQILILPPGVQISLPQPMGLTGRPQVVSDYAATSDKRPKSKKLYYIHNKAYMSFTALFKVGSLAPHRGKTPEHGWWLLSPDFLSGCQANAQR